MRHDVAIIGGGPAGLMAAEILAAAGQSVTVYDRKPSVGRKFLMAGRGGLNLTHGEDLATFLTRYGPAAPRLEPALAAFPPARLRAWCEELGQKTFVGTSGRVFPESLKASPLLRAWIARLEDLGVVFHTNHEWLGWNDTASLVFRAPNGEIIQTKPAATILALGGASWPRLGSDGGWVEILAAHHIPITPLRPANCGFHVTWSDHFRSRFAGHPLKPIVLSYAGMESQGEAMITTQGIEGGAIYALSARLRDGIAAEGSATLTIDLRPGLTREDLARRLMKPRGRQSFTSHLRKSGGLSPVAIGLVMERPDRNALAALAPEGLADLITALPINLTAPFAIDRAISTAGGVSWDAIDENYMLKAKPGVYVIGEMLDWEAPTGGYLLQATFSTAMCAAHGTLAYLENLPF